MTHSHKYRSVGFHWAKTNFVSKVSQLLPLEINGTGNIFKMIKQLKLANWFSKSNHSLALFLSPFLPLLVVDRCAQKVPHSPDGIISFSLTHFSSPPLSSVSSSVPSAMLLIFILWSSRSCYWGTFIFSHTCNRLSRKFGFVTQTFISYFLLWFIFFSFSSLHVLYPARCCK